MVVWRLHQVHILGDSVSGGHNDTVDADFQVLMFTAQGLTVQFLKKTTSASSECNAWQGKGNIPDLGEYHRLSSEAVDSIE